MCIHECFWHSLVCRRKQKQFQKPSHCHSSSTCVLMQLLFVCCSVVNIHDIFTVVCYTWSYHMSLLFVAGGSACVSDDQLLLVYSTYIFLMGNFVPCVTLKFYAWWTDLNVLLQYITKISYHLFAVALWIVVK